MNFVSTSIPARRRSYNVIQNSILKFSVRFLAYTIGAAVQPAICFLQNGFTIFAEPLTRQLVMRTRLCVRKSMCFVWAYNN